jgi:hypothetical protein
MTTRTTKEQAMSADLATAFKSVAAAMVSLLRVIPGVGGIEVRNWGNGWVHFVCNSDELVLAAIAALNMEHEHAVSVCGTSAWNEGTVKLDGLSIRVTGPHAPIVRVEPAAPTIDKAQLAAAVGAAMEIAP